MFELGSKFVCRRRPTTNGFTDEMEFFIGKTLLLYDIDLDNHLFFVCEGCSENCCICYDISADCCEYYWHSDWVEKLKLKSAEPIMIQIIDDVFNFNFKTQYDMQNESQQN